MQKIVIAIDGYAGCGKSTTAKLVAKKLGYTYIDSGAMYRAVTLYFITNAINYQDQQAVNEALSQITLEFRTNENGEKQIHLNGKNVESQIRSLEVANQVSPVSSLLAVRKFLVEQQQQMGSKKGIVMDGRDIGTVVFPKAELKVFMTADIEARAIRRQKELSEKGQNTDIQAIIDNLIGRDQQDSSRKESPLRKADDAIEIDTTPLTIEEQVKKIISLAENLQSLQQN